MKQRKAQKVYRLQIEKQNVEMITTEKKITDKAGPIINGNIKNAGNNPPQEMDLNTRQASTVIHEIGRVDYDDLFQQ